jgi:hypothetical protein
MHQRKLNANEEMTSEGRIGIQRQRAEKVRKQVKIWNVESAQKAARQMLEAEG